MQLPWRRSFEEQIAAGAEREFEQYKRRCRELIENSRQRMRLRDEARKELSAVEAEIQNLHGKGVSLLGEMNAAMLDEDERILKQVQSRQDSFSRELSNAQSRKDRVAKRLAELEFDDDEAARELAKAGQEQIAQARARAGELMSFLGDQLEKQQREISEVAGTLTGESESHEAGEGEITEEPFAES